MVQEHDVDGECVEFYDFVPSYIRRPDVPFFVEMAKQAKGPILEAGCGTGRVLIPMAKALAQEPMSGQMLIGTDLSEAMLAVCRRKLSRETPEVRSFVQIVPGDMCIWNLDHMRNHFRLIVVPFRAFQHLLTVEDQLAALNHFYNYLAYGGQLVIDVFNPDINRLANRWGSPEDEYFTMPDGRSVCRTAEVVARDLWEQVLDVKFSYLVTPYEDCLAMKTFEQRFRMRYFCRFEMQHLLERAGFRVENLYADYSRTPYGRVYPGELVFLARK